MAAAVLAAPGRYCQLVTDIDDTLYPNRALGVAGRDRRVFPGAPAGAYPGVCELGRALRPLPVLLLSARPAGLLDVGRPARALCSKKIKELWLGLQRPRRRVS